MIGQVSALERKLEMFRMELTRFSYQLGRIRAFLGKSFQFFQKWKTKILKNEAVHEEPKNSLIFSDFYFLKS